MKMARKIAILCGLLVTATLVWWMAASNGRREAKVTYSQLVDQVRAGEVAAVTITPVHSGAAQTASRLRDGRRLRTLLPADYHHILAELQAKHVDIEILDTEYGWRGFIMRGSPFLLLLAIWIAMLAVKPRNGWAT